MAKIKIKMLKGHFFGFFSSPPLRIHRVGGCWDRTQDSYDYGNWLSYALTARLDLFRKKWSDTTFIFFSDFFHGGPGSPAHLHATLQSAHLQQLQQLQNHIMRSAELRSSPFLSPQNSLLHSSLHSAQQTAGYFPIFGTSGSPFAPPSAAAAAATAKEPPTSSASGGGGGKEAPQSTTMPSAASSHTPPYAAPPPPKPESSSNVVSSTMEDDDKTTIKVRK